METIRGKRPYNLDSNELQERIKGYDNVLLDLGTGDGRFVTCLAERHQEKFFIGIDACRENLRLNSQRNLPNALFIIASAQTLPHELNQLASHVNINFPWGSLLGSLLNADPSLLDRLDAITCPPATMDVNLNADALITAGWALESGANQIQSILNAVGWRTKSRLCMDASALRSFSTTWAKRLAFGRDPRAIHLSFQKG